MFKNCAKCDDRFTARRSNQKYCPKSSCRTRGKTNTKARDAKREEHAAKPLLFVGVDGEGFKRPGFISFESIDSQDEIDVINQLIVDGEIEVEYEEDPFTGNLVRGFWEEDAYHAYEMLTIGDKTLGKPGVELGPDEIFEFLYSYFEDTQELKPAFVGFFLGYDFTMWLRHLYWRHAHKLLTKEGIASRTRYLFDDDGKLIRSWKFPVTLWKGDGSGTADWEIEMLGNKRLSIRRWVPYESRKVIKTETLDDGTIRETREPHPHKWMNICDAGPFFQTSFLNAINPAKSTDPIVSAEEYEILKRGKANRDRADFTAETIEYNVLENEVLKRLMTQLNSGFLDIGIKLGTAQFYGPGAAAQKKMDEWKVPTREDVSELLPEEFEEAARDTYYGGNFETMILGPFPGTVHEYDINSAYPYIIEQLPCLCAMTYTSGNGRVPDDLKKGEVVIVDVQTFAHRDSRKLPLTGGLPHRNYDGSIMRPIETRGLHFLHEVEAARRAGCFERARVYRWWRYSPGCSHMPFSRIRQMYQERLRVGKNTPRGIALKLVYNSMYGKLAQSVGMPKYANPLYASLITSGCRTMILEAIAQLPNKTHDVLMVATDGLYTSAEIPDGGIEIDPETLGAWEHTALDGFTVIMPGVHYTNKTREDITRARAELGLGGKPDYSSIKIKSRGVSARDIGGAVGIFDEQFADIWNRPDDWFDESGMMVKFPHVKITVDFSLTSPKLALARGKWSTCGTVQPVDRVISSNPETKRRAVGVALDESGRPFLRSFPYIRGEDVRTKFYRALFGSQADTPTIFLEDLDTVVVPTGETGGHMNLALGRGI